MDGTVILVESTLEPGTLDGFLEWLQAQGLRDEVGRTWFLACCPRRDWFADPEKNLETLPRIVGGVTAACTERALTILSAVSRTLLPTTYRTAEVTKALENALLHVPVMLAHELALGLPELDVAEALQLAGTHWRLTPLYLGFGTGGRCVPLGSEYLNNALHARGSGRQLVQEALRLDQRMRRAIAEAAAHWCPPPATALVLGIGYRPEFADVGRSPGRDVARELLHRGFGVSVHDPLLSESQLARLTGIPVWPGGELKQYDVILLATPHKAYAELPACAGFRPGQVVIDGQGAWRGYADGLKELAVHYVQVGTPGWRGPARTEPRRA
jgi:nucleotide sugar dehydrogenase